MSVNNYAIEPVNGVKVAQFAWSLSRGQLEGVIPPGAPETALEEVRTAFAAWASARPYSLFADYEAAWNQFIAPRYNLPGNAVLLPGNTCPSCRSRRYEREELNRLAYADCHYCKGMGHLPPRAIPARLATAGYFSRPAIAADEGVTEVLETQP